MALATSYTRLEEIRVDFFFNNQEGERYRPLTMRAQAVARTSDGGRKDVSSGAVVGNLINTPLTNNQIYTQLGLVTNLHTRVQALLKQLYTDAIAEDISV